MGILRVTSSCGLTYCRMSHDSHTRAERGAALLLKRHWHELKFFISKIQERDEPLDISTGHQQRIVADVENGA